VVTVRAYSVSRELKSYFLDRLSVLPARLPSVPALAAIPAPSPAPSPLPVSFPVSKPNNLSYLVFTLIDATTNAPWSTPEWNDHRLGRCRGGSEPACGDVVPNTDWICRFEYDGAFRKLENNNPYSFGAKTGLDYLPWTPVAGSHSIKATVWTDKTGTGSFRRRCTLMSFFSWTESFLTCLRVLPQCFVLKIVG
jgi:hypothetical protein